MNSYTIWSRNIMRNYIDRHFPASAAAAAAPTTTDVGMNDKHHYKRINGISASLFGSLLGRTADGGTAVRCMSSVPAHVVCYSKDVRGSASTPIFDISAGSIPDISAGSISDISVGSIDRLIDIDCSDKRIPISNSEKRRKFDVVMVYYSNGTLTPSGFLEWPKSEWPSLEWPSLEWPFYMRPARDRCEQNVEVGWSNGRLSVRSIKQIYPGEELLVWYSDDLARKTKVPILTPLNFTISQQYICTACSTRFQFPNPLKAHIRFHCRFTLSKDNSQPANAWSTRVTSFLPSAIAPMSMRSSAYPECRLDKMAEDLRVVTIVGIGETPRKIELPQRTTKHCTSLQRNHIGNGKISNVKCGVYNAREWKNETDLGKSGNIDDREMKYEIYKSNNDIDVPPKHFQKTEIHEKSVAETTPNDDVVTPIHNKATPTRSDQTRRKRSCVCHPCSFCGREYSRKYGLTIHLRTHTGQKPLRCKICSRAFGDPSNLNKHIRLHSNGDSPYRCRQCDKVLVRRRDLERHIRSRHPPEVENGSEQLNELTSRSETQQSRFELLAITK